MFDVAHDLVPLLMSSQALVLHPEQSASLPEEIQGMSSDSLLKSSSTSSARFVFLFQPQLSRLE